MDSVTLFLKHRDSDTRYRSQKAWLLEHVLRSTQNTSYDLTMNILHNLSITLNRKPIINRFPLLSEMLWCWMRYNQNFIRNYFSTVAIKPNFGNLWDHYTQVCPIQPTIQSIFSVINKSTNDHTPSQIKELISSFTILPNFKVSFFILLKSEINPKFK